MLYFIHFSFSFKSYLQFQHQVYTLAAYLQVSDARKNDIHIIYLVYYFQFSPFAQNCIIHQENQSKTLQNVIFDMSAYSNTTYSMKTVHACIEISLVGKFGVHSVDIYQLIVTATAVCVKTTADFMAEQQCDTLENIARSLNSSKQHQWDVDSQRKWDNVNINEREKTGEKCDVVVAFMYQLDILFSSNHNIHKSSCGLCFSASDPLINRFY